MSISVTKNVSSVTDVMALLSNLGFDTGSNETPKVVIDSFDHWSNRVDGRALICTTSLDVAMAA